MGPFLNPQICVPDKARQGLLERLLDVILDEVWQTADSEIQTFMGTVFVP